MADPLSHSFLFFIQFQYKEAVFAFSGPMSGHVLPDKRDSVFFSSVYRTEACVAYAKQAYIGEIGWMPSLEKRSYIERVDVRHGKK